MISDTHRQNAAPGRREPSRRRKAAILATAVAGLALAIGGYFLLQPPPAPTMATTEVRIGDIEQTVVATGKIRPKELVSVGAQVSGQVRRIDVSLGQQVRAGQQIAEIDPRPQELALRDAQAAVETLRAQRAARAAVQEQAALAFERQRLMLAKGVTARVDYEAARASLTSLKSELRSFDAQIVQAQAQVDTARINLGYTRVVAPMDGVVVAVVTKQGQTVNALQDTPTIVMLARLDVMTIRAEISEADVEKIKPGQTVWFTTLGAPDQRRQARLDWIEPAPESIVADTDSTASAASASTPKAIYYNALFDVPNADGRLRPSMTAQVSVLLAQVHDALIIPVAALQRGDGPDRGKVRVLDAHGRPVERRIRTGASDDSNIVVLSGLRLGEKVVIAQAAPDTDGDSGANVGG